MATMGALGDTLTYSLNRLAQSLDSNGRPTLAATGAANKWAGTAGKGLQGALNTKNGSLGLALQGVLNALAGTSGKTTVSAAQNIPGL